MFRFKDDQPLWLPEGSIRAILALMVLFSFVFLRLGTVELVYLVVGFYFGQKVNNQRS